MGQEAWREILLPPGSEDLLWEIFHENSKVGRHTQTPSSADVREQMSALHESLPYDGYPAVQLPRSLTPLKRPLAETIATRISALSLTPCLLSLKNLATLLHYAYGITRDNADTTIPRPFRVVPSGGALYPLEIYFHSAHIDALEPGIYHFNPLRTNLRRLRPGNASTELAQAVLQPDVVQGASLVIFITAIFERSIFKYGDRGYRFILLEAGHVAQNINLVANALGLASRNLGGFYDREMDDLLGIDGVTHSTIYLTAIGAEKQEQPLG